MTVWNKSRITFGAFLAYFVMSAVISPLGVVSAPIAEHFGISVTTATATFTYLTTGLLVGTLIAVFVFDYIRLRYVVGGGMLLIALSIYAMYAIDNMAALAAGLALIGALCGIELSAGAVVITGIFEEKLRASMLLLTDSIYSIAGVLSTFLAGIFLARGLHWSSTYLLAFVATLIVVIISILSSYPETRDELEDGTARDSIADWPASVHLVGLAMLAYLVGLTSIYSWIPNYANEAFGLDVEAGSQLVSRKFLGMFLGQLVMFVLVLKFPLRLLITVYSILATLLTASLWMVESSAQLSVAMLMLGLITGGVFKPLLTYGTTLVKHASPKMVSYLIFVASSGTAMAPFVSAFIVEQFAIVSALQFATACYLTMVILVAITRASPIREA